MNPSSRWSVAWTLVLFALFAPPARAQTAKAHKVATVEGITEYKFDNGVRLLLFPDPAASNVTINMTVLVGSRHEGYGESGMAHLLEHMNFKGTSTYPKVGDIDKMLQEHGANKTANATTWLDRTNYFETMPGTDKNLEFGIRLKADILLNSLIRQEDLDKEMTVVRNEFERNENDPLTVLSQRMTAVAFEWHNYGKTTMGNRADIERVPTDNLKVFYRKYYQPDNIVLLIAGKFDEKKAIAYVEKYFGTMKRPSRVLKETYTEEPAQDGERVVVLRRVGKVPVVGAMYHIPGAAHEDFAAIDVLTTMLTQEPSGRLYKALVKTKKALGLESAMASTFDPYVMEFYAAVADKVSPEEVRDILLDVLEKLGDAKLTEAEVERAKKKLATDQENLMSKTAQAAMQLSEWIGAGDWRLMFMHRDRVAKVTVKDVAAVAKKYLKPSNRTVGMFLPTAKPDRTPLPETTDIAKLVAGYKGAPAPTPGEDFDPTPENLEKRVKRLVLPSGVKVAFLSKKTRGEIVVGSVALRFGNEQSLLGKTTAASFMGSLMMRGTTKFSYEEIEDELIVLGAKLGASSSVSSDGGSLSLSMQCKRDKLAKLLNLVHEVLRNPVFPEDELAILKSETRQSLEKGLTDPGALAGNALSRKLNPFPTDSIFYVPTITESMERVDKVTRSDIVKLYNEQIGGTVGEIVFVGDFDEAATQKQLETLLKDWKAKTESARIPRSAKIVMKGGTQRIETPDKENAVYVAGYQLAINDDDPDYPALVMANYILGASAFNSRIVDRLRVKEGLCYTAGSSFRASALDKYGVWSLNAICNPLNMDKLNKSMHEVLVEFFKNGVQEAELGDGKKAYLQERHVDRESDFTVLGELMGQLHLGRTYKDAITYEKRISALTVAQVNAAIQRHFAPGRFYIVEAGDFAKGAKK
jgi:zinc protease